MAIQRYGIYAITGAIYAGSFPVAALARHYGPFYKGIFIVNKRFVKESGTMVVEEGYAKPGGFGVLCLASPGLEKWFEKNAL